MSKDQAPEKTSKARKVKATRAFDAPYRGTTTFYTEGQVIADPKEIAYLESIKAPVAEV
ncbi:hypothetical protein D3C86_1349010 [compost metagenome]